MFKKSEVPVIKGGIAHLCAPGPDRDFAASAEEALRVLTSPQELYAVTFATASKQWLEYKSFPGVSGRSRFVSRRSLHDLGQYIDALSRAFGKLIVRNIHAGHIREYQIQRTAGKLGPEGKPEREVGPNRVNQETATLIRILKYAHCWTTAFEELYTPLQKEESDIPRALAPAEQQLWINAASSRPQWHVVYWYSLLGFDCPLSTNEARGLRLGDLDLDNNMVMVRVQTSKNKYRTRSIPLSDTARWAVDMLVGRAKNAGCTSPQHYLFPFRKGRKSFPDKPMTVSGIVRHWEEVRKASGLTWFRPYDLRHTSITRYAEAGTPIAVIMALAGHISPRMTAHYTHVSEQAKRKAVQNAGGKYVVRTTAG